jgi:AcrR family transcriptional regulator
MPMTSDRKNQIITEATRLFGRHGFSRVTIKQLADICGITEPALYRYFPSKEALYDTVLETVETELNLEDLFMRLEREIDFEKILSEVARHIMRMTARHPDLVRLSLYASLGEHAKARQLFRTLRGPYITFLNGQFIRFQREGRIGAGSTEMTARCFVGMMFDCAIGLYLWPEIQGKAYDVEEIIGGSVPIFAAGLLAGRSDH